MGKVSDADFWIDETLEPSPKEIRSRVREFVCERGALDLVIVDYLQLMVNSQDNIEFDRLIYRNAILSQIADKKLARIQYHLI